VPFFASKLSMGKKKKWVLEGKTSKKASWCPSFSSSGTSGRCSTEKDPGFEEKKEKGRRPWLRRRFAKFRHQKKKGKTPRSVMSVIGHLGRVRHGGKATTQNTKKKGETPAKLDAERENREEETTALDPPLSRGTSFPQGKKEPYCTKKKKGKKEGRKSLPVSCWLPSLRVEEKENNSTAPCPGQPEPYM